MSDVTNYDGRLEAMANYCENMYFNMAKVNNVYHDSVENAYAKALPNDYLDLLSIKKIGGKTLVMNQIVENGDFASTTGWSCDYGTLSASSNVLTYAPTTFSNSSAIRRTVGAVSGHKYYASLEVKYNDTLPGVWTGIIIDNSTIAMATITELNAWKKVAGIGTVSTVTNGRFEIYPRTNGWSAGDTVSFRNVMCIDLTLLFGAGNEPATAQQFEEMFPAVYYAFNSGSLFSAGVTDIVSKDSNNDTLQTYSIPEEITTLEGYGWSCPGAYNYIDFDAKKFVYAVGSRAYESGDESAATVITDGTNTHYELDEPLAFDVELPDETITKAEAGGSLTFVNQHGDDYRIPVPVEIEYIGV